VGSEEVTDPTTELLHSAAKIREAEAVLEAARQTLYHAIREARTTMTCDGIASILGISKQRVRVLSEKGE